jgi:hypothetical protein
VVRAFACSRVCKYAAVGALAPMLTGTATNISVVEDETCLVCSVATLARTGIGSVVVRMWTVARFRVSTQRVKR